MPTSRKQLSRLLWLSFAAFIIYGTTIPFSFNLSPDHIAARLHRINWYPLLPGYSNSLFDDVQNVLLFLPFGFLGWTAIRDKNRRWKALAIVGMGSALSLFVEAVQVLSDTRTPAFTDLVFNTLGTALGVLGAMVLRRAVHGFAHHAEVKAFGASEAAYPALAFAALVFVGELAPFDFTLDFGQFKSKIHGLLAHPFALDLPSDDLIFLGRQILLAMFLGRLLKQRDIGHAAVRIFLAGIVASGFGIGLELCQMIVSSRGPAFQDCLVLVLGSWIGAVLVPVQGWRRYPLFGALLVYVCVAASAALKELHPFHFGPWQADINLMPFLAEYAQTSFLALARFIEDALVWAPLGFCWAYLLPGQALTWALAIGAAMATGVLLEISQGFIPGRYPDITDVLSAGMGALIGYGLLSHGRKAFQGYLSEEE